MSIVASFVLLVWIQCSLGAMRSVQDLRDSAVVVAASDGEYRSFSAEWLPSQHPRYINLTGVELKGNAQHYQGSAVEFIMDTFNQSSLSFAYFTATADVNGNNTNVDIAAIKFVFRTFAVFEYVERNNIPGFQNGTSDLFTGFYDLSDPELPWKDLVIDSMNVTANGTDYNIFFVTAQTLDEVFTIRFVVTGTNIEVEGKKLNPSTCKIDIDIKWFTEKHVQAKWTTGPSPANLAPRAQVAMVSGLLAAAATFNEGTNTNPLNNSNPTISFSAGQFVGFFSYEDRVDVTVDEQTAPGDVYATITEETVGFINDNLQGGYDVRVMWFSFEGFRPSEISWDPEFGAAPSTSTQSSTTDDSSSSILFVPSALLAIACMFLALF